MLTIEIRFPTGRYHATPWDQHVNEGIVEWPPSPWRLLRALVATWYLKGQEEVEQATLSGLIESLASCAPEYSVPFGATSAHSRHYVPIGQVDKNSGLERTTKVFDTFVHLPAGEALLVMWPGLHLDSAHESTLRLLVERMGYLGRAESWIEASLVQTNTTELDSAVGTSNVCPLRKDDEIQEDQELVRLMCPRTSRDIATWRSRIFEELYERRLSEKREKAEKNGKDPKKEKLSKAEKDKIDAVLPRDLLDALEAETGALQKQGWSSVPGAQWVDYARPRELLSIAPARNSKKTAARLPTTARFAVASQVPPRLTEAVSFAEKVRAALMSRADGAPVFSGKEATNQLLIGHQHAFILPESNREHGRISHLTVFAPMGFDETARYAFDTLRKVWGRGGHDVQLILLGLGQGSDFAGFDLQAGQCQLLVQARIWESRTPFVPTRHPKASRQGKPKVDETGLQIGSPEHDLRRLLKAEGYPEPRSIRAMESTMLGGKETRWLQYRTIRTGGDGARGASRGYGFRIEFDVAVEGPVALGYGAHFGLGMFVGRNE